MWEWLGVQAQSASPFVAVFCMMMLGVCGAIITNLWKQHIEDHQALLTVSRASTEANNAVALAIERSSSASAIAIERLSNQIGRRR